MIEDFLFWALRSGQIVTDARLKLLSTVQKGREETMRNPWTRIGPSVSGLGTRRGEVLATINGASSDSPRGLSATTLSGRLQWRARLIAICHDCYTRRRWSLTGRRRQDQQQLLVTQSGRSRPQSRPRQSSYAGACISCSLPSTKANRLQVRPPRSPLLHP